MEVRKPTSFRPPWVTDYVIDASVGVPFSVEGNHTAVGLYVGDQECVDARLTAGVALPGSVRTLMHHHIRTGRCMLVCPVRVTADWPIPTLCGACYGTKPISCSIQVVRMGVSWSGRCNSRNLLLLRRPRRPRALHRAVARASRDSTRASGGIRRMPSVQSRARRPGEEGGRGLWSPRETSDVDGAMRTIRLKSGTVQQLSPIVYVDRPQASTAAPRVARAPCAVLLCGWMNGELKYLHKYVGPYRRMFPDATILILLSTLRSTFLARSSAHLSTAQLIKEELLQAGCHAAARGAQAPPQMAVHYFSNGGLLSLSMLMENLHDTRPEMPLPMATIFDCVPGVLSEPILRDAATMNFPRSSWQYWLTSALVRTYFWKLKTFGYANHPYDNLDVAKAYQNTLRTWQWQTQRPPPEKLPPRLYLYTRADAFIGPEFVSEHAAEAQRVNREPLPTVLEAEHLEGPPVWPPLHACRTRQLVWDTPSHCQMARHSPDLYWSTVEQFLQEAMTLEPERAKL